MKLKCIGGECDGQDLRVEDLLIGDAIKITKYIQNSSFEFNPEEIPPATITYYVYIIDCFNFSKDDRYYFLRPENFTSKEAILWQFGK